MAQKSYSVQPVLKALRLLEVVAWKGHDVSLTEIVRETHLPKTTAFRYLQTLSVAGFVRHDLKTDRYGIGPRVGQFAETATSLSRLRHTAVAQMQELARGTHG